MDDQAQVRIRKSINIPFPLSLPFIPLLFLGAAVSIPWGAVQQQLANPYYIFLADPELKDFRDWCDSRFLNELSGSGKLVEISEKQREALKETLSSTSFLVTWKPKRKSRDRSLDG